MFRRVDDFSNSEYLELNNGDLKIDFNKQVIYKKDIDCKLTKSEFNILVSLVRYPKKVFTRDELIEVALGDDFSGFDRAIDSHIKNLRSKIEDDTSKAIYIITVRGFGYRFGDWI